MGVLATIFIFGLIFGAYQFGKNSSTVLPTPTLTKKIVSPTPSVKAATVKNENDNELIKLALLKKHGWNENEITVKVTTSDGKYASGTVSGQGGGGYFYAAKTNGVWEIVADGNGVILCSSLTKYPDFPKTLISECFDQPTGKSVKR